MKQFIVFNLILVCFLFAAEARIDNKFSTEYKSKRHDPGNQERHVPIVDGDVVVDEEEYPREDHVVQTVVDKVKGHMKKEGHGRHHEDDSNVKNDKKKHQDHGHSEHAGHHDDPDHDSHPDHHDNKGHQVKGTQVKSHKMKDNHKKDHPSKDHSDKDSHDKEHHNKDNHNHEKSVHDSDRNDHGFNTGERSKKMKQSRGKNPGNGKKWKVNNHMSYTQMKKEKHKRDRRLQKKDLVCKCSYCKNNNHTCTTDGACFVNVEKYEHQLQYKYGCLEKKQLQPPFNPIICHTNSKLAHKSAIMCCHDNMCNEDQKNEPQLSTEPYGEASNPCSSLKCKRKQVCIIKPSTGMAQCIKLPKKILKQRRKIEKKSAWKNKDVPKKHAGNKKSGTQNKKAHKMVKKLKHKADKFQHKYEERKRHHLHHMKAMASHNREPNHVDISATHQVADVNSVPQNTAPEVPETYCSRKDLSDMGKRLLDLFKVLQDSEPVDEPHIIQKRNSKKKELHEQDECICQAPVRSEFLRLDKNLDDSLSVAELHRLESNGHEHCIRPFMESCDHDNDGTLSDREWCCCFADVLPPCLTEMTKVPTALTLGAPSVLPGAFVPQCDSDGFFRPVQCHGSTGYCWCVNRSGIKLEGTHTRGTPDCANTENKDNSNNFIDLE